MDEVEVLLQRKRRRKAQANGATACGQTRVWCGAQFRRRCGRGEPSPGADVGGVSPIPPRGRARPRGTLRTPVPTQPRVPAGAISHVHCESAEYSPELRLPSVPVSVSAPLHGPGRAVGGTVDGAPVAAAGRAVARAAADGPGVPAGLDGTGVPLAEVGLDAGDGARVLTRPKEAEKPRPWMDASETNVSSRTPEADVSLAGTVWPENGPPIR